MWLYPRLFPQKHTNLLPSPRTSLQIIKVFKSPQINPKCLFLPQIQYPFLPSKSIQSSHLQQKPTPTPLNYITHSPLSPSKQIPSNPPKLPTILNQTHFPNNVPIINRFIYIMKFKYSIVTEKFLAHRISYITLAGIFCTTNIILINIFTKNKYILRKFHLNLILIFLLFIY